MHIYADSFIPFISWIRHYTFRHFKADLFAGLTVAVVAVPQSMACALIAGLPVQYGLYASIVPTIIGALWGSSSHLVTGPTTAISLVVFTSLINLAEPGTPAFLELALLMALMVGILQIVMGLARLGNLLNFISHSVLLGFTAGAAVLIAFKQLPGLLGIQIEKGGDFISSLLKIFSHLHETHPYTLLTGLATLAVILILKKIRPNWPSTLIAMILVGSAVALFHLDAKGVAVIGKVPQTLPPFRLPGIGVMHDIGRLAPGALAIALLGMVEAISIARAIADQTRQRLNVNREFIGQGLANISASFFSGYPSSGSFVRSAMNFRSGGITPVSAVISGTAVAVTVLVAAPLAAILPLSSLAAVLMVVAYGMVHKSDIIRTFKATRSDAAVMLITFLSTLLLNIEFAIYVGVLLSIGLHLANTSHPHMASVIPDLGTGKVKPAGFSPICLQLDIIHIEGSIFFGSATFVLSDLHRRMRNYPNISNLLLRMHRVNNLDASGIHVLEIIYEDVRSRCGGIYFAGMNHQVFEVVKNSGLLKEVGETHIRSTTGVAIRQAMRESFCPAICATCPHIVFEECQELKKGNWEIFGKGVQPQTCAIPHTKKDHSHPSVKNKHFSP